MTTFWARTVFLAAVTLFGICGELSSAHAQVRSLVLGKIRRVALAPVQFDARLAGTLELLSRGGFPSILLRAVPERLVILNSRNMSTENSGRILIGDVVQIDCRSGDCRGARAGVDWNRGPAILVGIDRQNAVRISGSGGILGNSQSAVGVRGGAEVTWLFRPANYNHDVFFLSLMGNGSIYPGQVITDVAARNESSSNGTATVNVGLTCESPMSVQVRRSPRTGSRPAQ